MNRSMNFLVTATLRKNMTDLDRFTDAAGVNGHGHSDSVVGDTNPCQTCGGWFTFVRCGIQTEGGHGVDEGIIMPVCLMW